MTNLPSEYSAEQMKEIFNGSGLKPIKSNLLTDDSGKSKCAGFVEFANSNDAQQAVKHANNMNVSNKRLNVQLAKR